MNSPSPTPLLPTALAVTLMLSAACLQPVTAQTASDQTTENQSTGQDVLPAVRVVGERHNSQAPTEKTQSYSARHSRGATGLGLSLRETPQSVSILTRSLLDDFQLDSVNDALGNAIGVSVERPETDRTYYTARGFDITNFQEDGIGVAFPYGLANGDLDTVAYDRVEVIRGANGLMSGTGNPSATVNFVRKRPTGAFQASGGLKVGSWNDRRLEGDISGALNDSGTVRGRFVAAWQDKDSYLQRYSHRKATWYGVLEADVTDSTTLALGHTQQKNRPRSPLWGALPLVFSDGTPTHYDREVSTSVDWAYWNNDTDVTFAEATHRLDGGWETRAVLTRKAIDAASKLFYVYGTPDPVTGLGLFSWPSQYTERHRQDAIDLRASGPVTLGGRQHEVVLGASWAQSRISERSMMAVNLPLPDLASWDGAYEEPVFDIDGDFSAFKDRQRRVFAAAHINASDRFKLVVGASHTSADSQGVSYSTPHTRSDTDLTPYLGGVYELSPGRSAYASYTRIFNPQVEATATGERLDPAKGHSLEGGLKAEWLNGKLQGTAAVFKTEQQNLATNAGTVGGRTVYEGQDTASQGVEFELAGELSPRWKLRAGYTHVSIHDAQGQQARTYTPRQQLQLASTYQVPGWERLKVGATVNWRSGVHTIVNTPAGDTVVRQGSYALLNLMARYDLSRQLSVSVNVDNVTNEKYLTSLYWSQGFYGAPVNGSVALNWTY